MNVCTVFHVASNILLKATNVSLIVTLEQKSADSRVTYECRIHPQGTMHVGTNISGHSILKMLMSITHFILKVMFTSGVVLCIFCEYCANFVQDQK